VRWDIEGGRMDCLCTYLRPTCPTYIPSTYISLISNHLLPRVFAVLQAVWRISCAHSFLNTSVDDHDVWAKFRCLVPEHGELFPSSSEEKRQTGFFKVVRHLMFYRTLELLLPCLSFHQFSLFHISPSPHRHLIDKAFQHTHCAPLNRVY
jgi:hypothetical protein